jgi:hypothetical protein
MTLLRIVVFAGLLSASATALAFDPEVHAAITRKVLADKTLFGTLSDNTQVRFSARQIDAFVQENVFTDKGQATDERMHFDNEALVGGATLARRHREHVITALKAETNLTIWKPQIGFLLHATQDFYSHSTWINFHPGATTIASLSDATPDSRLLPKAQIGEVCGPNATSVIAGRPVTSGYFPLIEGGSDYLGWRILTWAVDADPQVPGKCNHGFKTVSGVNGINKDRPDSNPEGGNPFHTEAVDRATVATRDLITKMLTELKGNDAALCRFTGDERNCSRWMYRFTNFVSAPFVGNGLPYTESVRIRRYPLNQNNPSQDVTTNTPLGTAGRGEVTFMRPPNSQMDIELRVCRRGDKWLPFTRSYSIVSPKPANTFTAYNLVSSSCPTSPVGPGPHTAPITLTFKLTEDGVLTVTRSFVSEQAVACALDQATGTVSYNEDVGLELDLSNGGLDFHEKRVESIDIRNHSPAGSSRNVLETSVDVARSDANSYDITLTSGALNRISGTVVESEEAFPADCQMPLAFCAFGEVCTPTLPGG